jgi:hypothetical protein
VPTTRHARELGQLQCKDGQDVLYFEVLLDAKPKDTSWTLICDKAVVWNVPTGSLTKANIWITDETCVDASTSTCIFSLSDAAGDGFVGDGWFSLTYGADTIGVAEYPQVDPFSDLSFCIGVSCAGGGVPVEDTTGVSAAVSVAQQQLLPLECNNDEKLLAWQIMFDSNPKETSWRLVCDGDEFWNVPAGTYRSGSANTWVTKSICISSAIGYCNFILADTAGNGFAEGDGGWYSLTLDAETIAVYQNDGSYSSDITYCFGPECFNACNTLWFEMELDETPLETRIEIVCNGQMLWKYAPGADTQASDWITHEVACMDAMSCCKLTIFDSGNNGMTSGSVYLQLNDDTTAASYVVPSSSTGAPPIVFSEWTTAFSGSQRQVECSAAMAAGV